MPRRLRADTIWLNSFQNTVYESGSQQSSSMERLQYWLASHACGFWHGFSHLRTVHGMSAATLEVPGLTSLPSKNGAVRTRTRFQGAAERVVRMRSAGQQSFLVNTAGTFTPHTAYGQGSVPSLDVTDQVTDRTTTRGAASLRGKDESMCGDRLAERLNIPAPRPR